MSANPWRTDEILTDLKHGRKHTKNSEACWCVPGQWFPENMALGQSFTSYVPSEDEADIDVIKCMPGLDTKTAETWIKCIREARSARRAQKNFIKSPCAEEPEGVSPCLLRRAIESTVGLPTPDQWVRIKSIASTVVSFWANGYANENAEKYGSELSLAKSVLSVRDMLEAGENVGNYYWLWLKQHP